MSNNYSVLGKNVVKVDAVEKVLGTAKFAGDYFMPDMLYGGVFRSTVPHAKIKKLNLEKARALPGVHAVLDYTAIPGKNRFGIIVKDEPCLVDDKVRRYGDAIAVIAAETQELVEEAKELIEVEYEPLDAVFTVEEAMAEGAPLVHNGKVQYNSGAPFREGRYSSKHVFSTLIKCEHCGRSYTRKSYTYAKTRVYWRCVTNDQYTAEKCDNRVLVDEPELQARRQGWEPLPPRYTRGVLAKYSKLVQSASTGAICR